MPPRPTVRQERARAWLALPDRERLTMAEAARQLGCGEGALKASLSRARKDGVIPLATIQKPGPKPRDISIILEEWEWLHAAGATVEDVAPRLGLKPRALTDIINRRTP